MSKNKNPITDALAGAFDEASDFIDDLRKGKITQEGELKQVSEEAIEKLKDRIDKIIDKK